MKVTKKMVIFILGIAVPFYLINIGCIGYSLKEKTIINIIKTRTLTFMETAVGTGQVTSAATSSGKTGYSENSQKLVDVATRLKKSLKKIIYLEVN